MRKIEGRIGMQLHMIPADISAAANSKTDIENQVLSVMVRRRMR